MNRMTVYDQTRLCFKVTPHQEPGRSVIQELGIYEDIHEEEIKKARNITDIRDLYFTKGAKLDPYWENLGKPKTERSGWIPVSERLPKLYTFVYATCHSLVDDRENWVIETCYVPIPKEYNSRKFSDWGNIPMLNHGEAEVIAWMERDIPEPYKAESEVRDADSD